MKNVVENTDKSTIAADMVIEGDIKTGGDLDVLGSVTGNVEINGALMVEGCVMGSAHSATFQAGTGQVTGDITVDDYVVVERDAIILGNIHGKDISVNGAVKGNIDATNRLSLGATAKIKGDIKAAAMQMEPGAVIDGSCTLCYASVTADQFFERLENPEEYEDESAVESYDYDDTDESPEDDAELEYIDDEDGADTSGTDGNLDLEAEKFIRSLDGEDVPISEAGAGSTVKFVPGDRLSAGYEQAVSM